MSRRNCRVTVAWNPIFLWDEPGNAGLTTVLNLTRDVTPSLISRMASSGSVETSKFSWMRLGILRGGEERRPALDGPRERNLGRGLANPPGDAGDDRILEQIGLAVMA